MQDAPARTENPACPSRPRLRRAQPFFSVLVTCLWVATPLPASAEEQAQGNASTQASELNREGGLPEFDPSRRHHLSGVLGLTAVDEGERGFTVGLDYEYRLNRRIGIGAVAGEYAFGDVDAATILLVTDIHLWRGLAMQTGPGIEILDLEREEAFDHEGDHEGDDELAQPTEFGGNGGPDGQFVYRIGLLYEVELGRGLTVSPQVHLDLVRPANGDSMVFAIAFGRAF